MTNQQERMDASLPVSSDQHVHNRGTCAQPLLRALLLAILLALPTTATAQIWIDEEEQSGTSYTNYDDISTATLNHYDNPDAFRHTLYNYGTIEDATVYRWGLVNNGYGGGTGYITTANVYGKLVIDGNHISNNNAGSVDNGSGLGSSGFIETANISDGGWVYNGIYGGTGFIGTANVDNRGSLQNGWGSTSTGFIDIVNIGDRGGLYNGGGRDGTGYIGIVNVDGGEATNGFNRGTGFIEVANVGDRGRLYNGAGSGPDTVGSTGYIGTVNVDGGEVTNGGGFLDFLSVSTGYIETVNIQSGEVINGTSYSTGNITTANVYGGKVTNGTSNKADGAGYIETANIYGGEVINSGFRGIGFITTANVYGGFLRNDGEAGSGWVGTVSLNGGIVENFGRIDNLTYTTGTYFWSTMTFSINNGPWETVTGTIGTLTLAGNSTHNTDYWGSVKDWGIVENLQFADNGSGILTITASVNSTDIFFINPIQADSVDLDYGNIVIDWSGALSDGMGFAFLDLFDTADVFGTLASLSIGEQQFYNVGTDWTFTYADGIWRSNDVPEPATLVVLGLGLAGLGLARRRRK